MCSPLFMCSPFFYHRSHQGLSKNPPVSIHSLYRDFPSSFALEGSLPSPVLGLRSCPFLRWGISGGRWYSVFT